MKSLISRLRIRRLFAFALAFLFSLSSFISADYTSPARAATTVTTSVTRLSFSETVTDNQKTISYVDDRGQTGSITITADMSPSGLYEQELGTSQPITTTISIQVNPTPRTRGIITPSLVYNIIPSSGNPISISPSSTYTSGQEMWCGADFNFTHPGPYPYFPLGTATSFYTLEEQAYLNLNDFGSAKIEIQISSLVWFADSDSSLVRNKCNGPQPFYPTPLEEAYGASSWAVIPATVVEIFAKPQIEVYPTVVSLAHGQGVTASEQQSGSDAKGIFYISNIGDLTSRMDYVSTRGINDNDKFINPYIEGGNGSNLEAGGERSAVFTTNSSNARVGLNIGTISAKCDNRDGCKGSDTVSLQVNYTVPPPTLSFTANGGSSATVNAGDSIILAWDAGNYNRTSPYAGATGFSGPSNSNIDSGSVVIQTTAADIGTTKTYKLKVKGFSDTLDPREYNVPSGQNLTEYNYIEKTVTVNVTGQVSCSLTFSDTDICPGQTLYWSGASDPTGLSAYWHGTKNGSTDLNDTFAGTTNFSDSYVEKASDAGTYTRYLHMQSGSSHNACTTNTATIVVRSQNDPVCNLIVDCQVSKNPVLVGESVTFSATPKGGKSPYGYQWTGDATGTGSSVTRSFSTAGTKTATVTITDNNGANASGNCQVSVNSIPPTLTVTPTNTVTPTPTDTVTPTPTPGTLSVVLSAYPFSGSAPLNGVQLQANVGGSATGTIKYSFKCLAGSGPYDHVSSPTNVNPYNTGSLCNYSTNGVYNAYVLAERGGLTAETTTPITVGAVPTPTPGEDLNVSLNANPDQGQAPLNSELTSQVVSGPGAPYTYYLWWNCSDPGRNAACTLTESGDYTCGVIDVCGDPGGGQQGSVTVRAKGTNSQGSYPQMRLTLIDANGNDLQTLATWTVDNNYRDYTINTSIRPSSGQKLRIRFINPVLNGSRKLYIDYLSANGTVFQTENVSPVIGKAGPDGAITDCRTTTGNKEEFECGFVEFDVVPGGALNCTQNSVGMTCIDFNSSQKIINHSYDSNGAYTAKLIVLKKGQYFPDTGVQTPDRWGEDHKTITVGATLTSSLTASPDSGNAPLNSTLTATAGGTVSGTINYTFWWNCDREGTDVSDLSKPSKCGNPNDSANGAKFDGINDNPKPVTHSYPSAGTYKPKVIIERGALAAESRTAVTVGNVPLPTPCVSDCGSGGGPGNPQKPAVVLPDYCTSGPSAAVSWIFSKGTPPQTAYQIQVDDQGSFNSPEYDSGKVNSSGSQSSTGNCNSSNPGGTGPGTCRMTWDKTYKARVKVWDSNDLSSEWSPDSDSWKTPKHAYPQADFSYAPLNPVVNQQILFTNTGTCYDDDNDQEACSSYSWNFGDGNYGSGAQVSHAYSTIGTKQTALTSTDRDGNICSALQTINVNKASPKFREIAP